jgi:hypothetical protein
MPPLRLAAATGSSFLEAALQPAGLITLAVFALSILMGLFAVSAGLFRSGGLDRLRPLIGSDAIRSPQAHDRPDGGRGGADLWLHPQHPDRGHAAAGGGKLVPSAPYSPPKVLLPNGSTITGTSVRDLRFRQRYNATLLAVRYGNQVLRELLGQVVLQAGDVLLLQAPLDAIRGMQANNEPRPGVEHPLLNPRLTKFSGMYGLIHKGA